MHCRGCHCGPCVWTSDCWLEVSVHQEGPATGQIDQGFAWFFSVLQQVLSRYPKCTSHCTLTMQPSVIRISSYAALQNQTQSGSPTFQYCTLQQSTSVHLTSLPNALHCFHPTLANRTSGHNLRTFPAVNFLFLLLTNLMLLTAFTVFLAVFWFFLSLQFF
jgi:hypothetical protein